MASIAESVAALLEEAERVAARAAASTASGRKLFRSSIGWRRARYAALAANAERHGGVARCELCGAGPPFHVDHIEALSKVWAKRLDPTNLQVLCEPCNVGKLDGPARDWRAAPLSAP